MTLNIETVKYGDREAWLAIRGRDVTASDIAAVCGASPWTTPLKVYARKKGMLEPEPENEMMLRGRMTEVMAPLYFADKHPMWEVAHNQFTYLRCPELRIGATPDFVVIDPERGLGNVQMKCVNDVSFRKEWRQEDGSIQVPLYYQLQAITEAKLLDAKWCALLALEIGTWSFKWHLIEVPIDEKAWDRIIAEVQSFCWHIDNDVPPPMRPAQDYETVKEMFTREDETLPILDLSAHNQLPELLAERAALKAAEKAGEDRMEEIEAQVMQLMGTHSLAALPGWKITWKQTSRKGYVVNPTTYRALSIRKQEQKNG